MSSYQGKTKLKSPKSLLAKECCENSRALEQVDLREQSEPLSEYIARKSHAPTHKSNLLEFTVCLREIKISSRKKNITIESKLKYKKPDLENGRHFLPKKQWATDYLINERKEQIRPESKELP